MTYVFDFDEPPDTSREEFKSLLGGKGHSLAVMRNELGLPVPPGFTITTQAGREFLSTGWPDGLDDEIRAHLSRLEDQVGRRFGGPGEPLLVSVRSGAVVSMPGMMDTILNLGLNQTTVEGLARACDDKAFAADSRERFTSMYRDIVGTDDVPDEPWEQLKGAVEAVFRSWDTPRAQSYREHEGIPHDLGTAVTVQAMVFGNLDDESATGVLFTRNPATGERSLYGDVMFRAQGEDVVAGKHSPESIATLDTRLPDVADELRRYAEILERHYQDVCDIEFTIERGKLWMLQARIGKRSPQAALRIAVEMAVDDGFPLTRAEAVRRVAHHLANPPATNTYVSPDAELLATGLAASPGMASGLIATTPESAVTMAESGKQVILVRPETSPDDVHGMVRVAGILTSRGGLASHAAVVARGWGIPAVVGASSIQVKPGHITVGGTSLEEGDSITIDGQSGEVFAGEIEVQRSIAPEAETLLQWAEELEIEIPSVGEPPNEEEAAAVRSTERGDDPPDTDTVVRALHIKGFATPEGLAPVVMSTDDEVQPVLDSLASEGLAKKMGEMYQLTEEGKALGTSLMEEDRRRWSIDRASEALDSFLPLDARMKEIVTAWQMRDVDGEQVMNDHSDPDYDAEVLADFAALHEEAASWLDSLTEGLPRLQTYLDRLNRAAGLVADAEHAYVASPRVDSYHNIWFELHEDLIQLAGRTREEETEAGRA